MAVRPPGSLLPFPEAAERAGLDVEEAARYWRALGFPAPAGDEPRLPPDAVDALALEVAERVAATDELPPVRVGLACGPVVGLHGDLFGEVVNLAARLVAVADEGTVVVDDAVRQAAGEGFTFVPLPARSLKGFGEDVSAYRLVG